MNSRRTLSTMSVQRMTRLYPWTGHVLGCENGVVRVQTNLGEVRATYSGRMLGMIARDRGCAAQVGDQAVLCAQVIELPAR
jgi:hypothetical protein